MVTLSESGLNSSLYPYGGRWQREGHPAKIVSVCQ